MIKVQAKKCLKFHQQKRKISEKVNLGTYKRREKKKIKIEKKKLEMRALKGDDYKISQKI